MAKKDHSVSKKWGAPLADNGWTAVPNMLLYCQKTLLLSPLDVNILLHLLTYWWSDDQNPFPSKKTIAQAIGVQPDTVRKRIKKLEEQGFVKREPREDANHRTTSNIYQLDGLIKALTPYAEKQLSLKKISREYKRVQKTFNS